jgi:hypothetical protein
VRDRNWGTVPLVLSHVEMMINEDTFHIAYDAENKENDIEFAWRGTLKGDRNETITFTMQGAARMTFWRNRLGICVLHPIEQCIRAYASKFE